MILFLFALFLAFSGTEAFAGGKVELYGLHLKPNGDEAEEYSDPGWGGGIHLVMPVPHTWKVLAGTIGFEAVNLMNEKVLIPEALGLFYAEQTTSRDYMRAYLGARIGGHGNGFLRPFAGFHIAWVNYSISTELSVPNDNTEDPFLSQTNNSNVYVARTFGTSDIEN